MKVQSISVTNGTSLRISKRNYTQNRNSSINFNGTVGKIQGGLKGAMIGGLVWAVGTMALPVLPLAVAVGALTVGAIDNKLEDMANDEENKKNK